MWETSNSPAWSRVQRCSARIPVGYCTGMAKPANGTIRAPRPTCSSCKGVCSSGSSAGTGSAIGTSRNAREPGPGGPCPAPPLSRDLRDFPPPARELRPSVDDVARHRRFPECQLPAVLLPERFRGGCAFGAGLERARTLPRGSAAALSLKRVGPQVNAAVRLRDRLGTRCPCPRTDCSYKSGLLPAGERAEGAPHSRIVRCDDHDVGERQLLCGARAHIGTRGAAR